MLFIKMMSTLPIGVQGLPDDHPDAGFTLITVGDKDIVTQCTRDIGEATSQKQNVLEVASGGYVTEWPLVGNAYIMNEQGKTLQTCRPW